MRILKTFLAMVLATSFLAACGGGSDNSQPSTNPAETAALYIAYDKINKGMSLTEVTKIVGYESSPEFTKKYTNAEGYYWRSNSGNGDSRNFLTIYIFRGGVAIKEIYIDQGVKSDRFGSTTF